MPEAETLKRSRRTLLWLIAIAAAIEFILQSAHAFATDGAALGTMWALGAVIVAGVAFSIETFKAGAADL